jgi:hypothetical protein
MRAFRPDVQGVILPRDPRPIAPEAPLPSDCCGGGCAICVNDAYQDELDAYRARLAAWLARHPETQAGDAAA